MVDFKDSDLYTTHLSVDILKNIQIIDPLQDQMLKLQQVQASIQRAREEKEAEELRRHNELVTALKEAEEKGATILIGDNANGIQIQQNSARATQEMINSQEFNYEKALEVLKEIKGYVDFPQFASTFKENSDNIKIIIDDTIESIDKKENAGLIKKSLRILRDLTIGAGGSLIASGIIALLGTLPL